MLNTGVIGLGNTGNQVAELAFKKLQIPVLAINSSDKDLETLDESIPKIKISDKAGQAQGAGKDRVTAKKYLKDSIVRILSDEQIVTMIGDLDLLFIVSSTGGGTGSGTAPIMASMLRKQFPHITVVLVGVLPTDKEALSSHVNTLEYLNELYTVLKDQTYIIYDNDRLSNLPNYQMLQKVNNEIVADIDVMRCYYNYATKFDSIDEKDMTRILSAPGRIFMARVEDIKEKDCDSKTIEDMLIEKIKTNCHAETQRDHKIIASGIITNLSENLSESFDNHVPEVRKFIGEPVHDFNHIFVNPDRKMPNNVFLIASGLSPINDRMNRISDRIEQIEEEQREIEEENALNAMDIAQLSNKIADKKEGAASTELDLTNEFAAFGINF